MTEPRVTVLLPARNAEGTVGRAVESVLEGTLRDLRLLAVDDGSTDGTRAVLESWAARDKRVEVLSGGGRGLVAALNLGLERVRTPYVARMDADDESLPRRLEASVAALEEEPGLAGVGVGVEVFREGQPVSPGMRGYVEWMNGLTTPERLHRERFVESPLCHPAVCLRREALEEAGGWEDGDFPEDYALWLKLLGTGHRLRNLPEVLFRWRDSDGRLTRTDGRYSRKRHAWLKAHWLARSAELSGRRVWVWGAGPTGLLLTRLLREEGVEVERLVDVHPRKVGTRIHGLPVVRPESLGGPEEAVHLVAAVGAYGVREEIRETLRALGWVEGKHFTCAA